ncbi:helix-turn-helix domain-containing protein [Catelliglobosispora koreensis]|uniref:helix-turn-helix domain-containing protein n=1 Tax=Catelliglobosispora koreensis TaxID=129052 RepID=UPI0003A306FA|nr:helix-turn-helix transcriptional regulator [Catelliglobosispora koreensis]
MPARGKGEAIPNDALYNARDARGESQGQVAEGLNLLAAKRGERLAFDGNQVSRWERGTVRPGRLASQLLAEYFGLSIKDLGLSRERTSRAKQSGSSAGSLTSVLITEDPTREDAPEVIESQREWLHIRRSLNQNHTRLAKAAALLYPQDVQLGETGILARHDWMLEKPIDLADVQIRFVAKSVPPTFTGEEDETLNVRPLKAEQRRYSRYSQAIRDVAKPTLFENRYCWRLLDATFADTGGALQFGAMHYFDAMDTCEALAHEFAGTHLDANGQIGRPSWRGLKFRKAIGDPFDLSQRPAVMSINTLTIRRDKTSASVILHNRNAANVATSGGIIGVMPAGVFQPSTVRTALHDNDFDLWRNIMREYSEEFLGNTEHDGDGPGANYATEPLRSLDAARQTGGIKLYCLGLGIGALDLWAGLETVAVIDTDVFTDLFASMVHINDEGTVVRVGSAVPTVHIPFTKEVIDELQATNRLAPETSLSLQKAWEHRGLLLS